MSKTKDQIIAEVSEQNEFDYTAWKYAEPRAYHLVKKFMEAYHLQFKPSDSEIEEMITEKTVNEISINVKPFYIEQRIKGAKMLRDHTYHDK